MRPPPPRRIIDHPLATGHPTPAPLAGPDSSAPTLLRALGVRQLTANIVNCIIGSGIFVLPATVAGLLGPAAGIAYLACSVLAGLVALCFAEVGSRVPQAGGTYAYAEAAFGPFVGAQVGVLHAASCVTANAAVISVLALSTGALVPALQGPLARAMLIVGLYAVIATLNVRGTRSGARLMELLTAFKLAPLVLLLMAGLFAMRAEHLAWPALPSGTAIGEATLVLMYAFIGIEGALASSGEVREPARTVPRAIGLGLLAVVLLYGGLQLVGQGVLGPALAADREAPLGAVAERLVGSPGRTIIVLAAILSALAFVSGDLLASSRMFYALGRGGLLPSALGAVHPTHRTPHVAIAVYTGLAALAALSGTYRTLMVITTASTLLIYLVCCLGVLELRRRGVRTELPPFRAPGGPVVPVLACVVVGWLFTSVERRELMAVGAVLLGAAFMYVVPRVRRVAV